MKKHAKKVEEEMTVTDVGRLVLSLVEKVESLDASLEKLAIMTHEGFVRVNGRLDRVESRLDKVEHGVKGLRSDMNEGFNSLRKDELQKLTLGIA